MATPPFNLDIADPTDGSIGQAFPANERAFRDNVNSFLTTDHDPVTGHHAIPLLTTAQITALTTPPAGMLVFDTTLGLFKVNTGTPATPVWTAIGPGTSGFHFQAFQAAGGSVPFTIPVTSLKCTVVGAGGGGGGGGFAATYGGGGGGGSGGAVIAYYTGLTVGNTITVSPGTHGTAGTGAASGSATAGGNGANSTVTSGTQIISSAVAGGGGGGGAGSSAGGGTGGAGGTTTVPPGSYAFNGSLGFAGTVGSAASDVIYGGAGGAPVWIGGAGTGGQGGNATPAAGANGNIGFDGFVIIEWLQ